MLLWSLRWCPWNAPVETYSFLIGCPLPRRKCLGALASLKTKHTCTGLYSELTRAIHTMYIVHVHTVHPTRHAYNEPVLVLIFKKFIQLFSRVLPIHKPAYRTNTCKLPADTRTFQPLHQITCQGTELALTEAGNSALASSVFHGLAGHACLCSF